MDEHEFDKKIRESALRHESQLDKPLWNKERVWNRIDSGLEKRNHPHWWKAAAVILILLSTGWSFAMWNNFRQYKLEKGLELSELQQQMDHRFASQKDHLHEEQILIQKQNRELDSLKRQILVLKEISKTKEYRKSSSVKHIVAEKRLLPKSKETLIDSIQCQPRLAQNTVEIGEVIKVLNEQKNANPEIKVFPKEILQEKHMYYINNIDLPQNSKKRRGIKIDFFGSKEDENIKYQSDHSIFQKQKL